MSSGLSPQYLRYPNKPDPPLWNSQDLIKTMEELVNADDQGYILQSDLIKKIGHDQVNSLIYYNFLHRRQTHRHYYDIIWPNQPILTAMNGPSVRAMEHIISNVKELP